SIIILFFFSSRRRHTRSKRDWSSDVCSSDLGKIDVEREQQLLKDNDRVIFQFPFYWYSSPAFLKQWQDEVLTEGFAHGGAQGELAGKEFGLIFMLGVHEREYQAGGRELYTI